MKKIYFYTLGCSKNTVDSQMMKDSLSDKYLIAEDIEDAEIVVVNTCTFIQSAKEESIDAILEIAGYKETGKLEKLIIAGCLAERYSEELLGEMPEADGILGTGAINELDKLLERVYEDDKVVLKNDINEKIPEIKRKDDVKIVEYVKISEGCNNNCSYCVIPKIRGRNRSRTIIDIYEEVSFLVHNGTKEIILIAQNTTDYGLDINENLTNLLKKLDSIEGDFGIRLLYLYLDRVDSELLLTIKNSRHIFHYFDLPIQHISDKILKMMNRKTSKDKIKSTLVDIRKIIPDSIIRTTLIVGFPGEREEDFKELLDFIVYEKFNKLGVFTYSREEGTPAYSMKDQVPEEEKERRLNIIMQKQSEISEELLEKTIGKMYRVLVEEEAEEGLFIGRTYEDAPEIDGEVWIEDEDLSIGEFYNVEITSVTEYDRYGRIV